MTSAIDDEFDLIFDDIGHLSEQTPTNQGSNDEKVVEQRRSKYVITEDTFPQENNIQTNGNGGTLERMMAYQTMTTTTTTTTNSEFTSQEISISATKYAVNDDNNEKLMLPGQGNYFPTPQTKQEPEQGFLVADLQTEQKSENQIDDENTEGKGQPTMTLEGTTQDCDGTGTVPSEEKQMPAEQQREGGQGTEQTQVTPQVVQTQHSAEQPLQDLSTQPQQPDLAAGPLRVNGVLSMLTMADGAEDKKDDKKPSAELLQAQEEWDALETVEPEFTGKGQEVTRLPLISFNEVLGHFQVADMDQYLKKIKPTQHRTGFAAFKQLLFGPPKMNRNLHEERNLIFAIAQCPFNNEELIHTRTLQTIYKRLTGNQFDCPRYGSHWEEIGFQGNDPATDLRATGFLGLMTLLYFVMDPNSLTLAREIYKLSTHEVQNFPFCVMSINMTRIVIQTLREEILSKECNRRQQVFGVINDFYVGIYLHLYLIWKKQHKTIKDSGYVLKDVEAFAKKNPRSIIRNMESYLSERSKQQSSRKATHEEPMDFAGVHELE
ncbi:ELMO domain-containing protein 3-like isoform X2 [Ptychodera flava]|uniref:ELMO domain-containing protein 3-like isoform X2 n=1 Tax=Ptychodera flava TaxID=63121 RepID=UPI00396AA970